MCGSFTRFGYVEVLYVTEFVGLLLIYAGIRAAVARMLVSPWFLFRVEGDSPDVPAGSGETDDYDIRLTRQPTANVNVALLTDGLADIIWVNGVAVTPDDYVEVGGFRPIQVFSGTIVFGTNGVQSTLTRGAGSDLGSFIDEGFHAGQLIRIGGGGAGSGCNNAPPTSSPRPRRSSRCTSRGFPLVAGGHALIPLLSLTESSRGP